MSTKPARPEPISIAVTLVPTSGGEPTSVVVTGDSATTFGEVRPLLPGRWPATPLYAGATEVDDAHLLGRSPLLHATQLTDRPSAAGRRPLLELAVAEGPAAGSLHPLTAGGVLGRDPACDIPLLDPSLSRAHARLQLDHGRVQVHDLGSTNGTAVDGRPVREAPRELQVGHRLRTGSTVSRLTAPSSPRPLPTRAGRLALSRPPRQVPELTSHELDRPHPPHDHEFSLPWLMLLLPIPAALVLALVLRSPMFLAFAAFSPLMMLGQYLHDHRTGRRSRRAQRAEFRSRTEVLERKVREHLDRELRDRRRLAPDLAELLAQAREGRCWARRPGDPDHLLWRVGTGSLRSSVTVRATDGSRETHDLAECPITVPIADHRVVGLAAPVDLLGRAVDGLLGQLVATHSPALLRILVLTERPGATERWGWLAWLPQLRAEPVSAPTVLDPDDDLTTALLAPWAREREERSHQAPAVHTVVLLDGDGPGRRPLVHDLLQHGRDHGVAVVATGSTLAELPPDCEVTAVIHSACEAAVLHGDDESRCVPDLPAPGWRDQLAAALSPLVDATPGARGGEPPAQVRLLDLHDEAPAAPAVRRRWAARRRSTEILLGLGADGPVTVDLVRDGPHALVGGTTGSGKSELLQTLIASLALGNRPDELTFLLVDYKGGAAFKDCVDLPHTVGLVTDLDPFLTRRALESLEAEIKRRERLLGEVGAKDLEDYQALRGDHATVPRLVLVIDEFRVLAEELPDFIDGLVRIAAVGRSLGIHLVLATQRPAGVVTADIRANVNLRIALRVREAGDSEDIIESPDAARISTHTPGRALLRTGSTPPVAVQTARVGGPADRGRTVQVLPVDPATGRVRAAPAPAAAVDDSDLSRVVTLLDDASHDIPRQPSPWLPTLPARVSASESTCAEKVLGDTPADPDVPVAVLGLLDLPAEQTQTTLGWSLPSGHLAVVGGPRSGRTTSARTVCASLASAWSPDDLHVYAIDPSGALSALAALPHVGAVVGGQDPTQTGRLLAFLAEEVTRRQQVLAAGDHSDLAEQRRDPGAGDPLPYVLLVLDGWDAFHEEYELHDPAVVDAVVQVLRDGAGVGVAVLLTGGRAALSGRVAGAITHRLVLRMADEMDLVMAGLRPTQVPREMPPGRALVLPDAHELQVAAPAEGAGGAEQSAALRRVAASAPPPQRFRPRRFSGLPDRLAWAALPAPGPTDHEHPSGLLLGLGGDDAEPVRLQPDPVHGRVALVAGPPRSGRTSALLTLAHQLRAEGPVLWLGCAGAPTGLPPGIEPADADSPDALWQRLTERPATLVVDDVELLGDGPLDELARTWLTWCAHGHGSLLVAGTTADLVAGFRGVAHDLRRRQTGLLLQPGRNDGDLLGTVVPAARRLLPGRGVLVQRGRPLEVQVALPP